MDDESLNKLVNQLEEQPIRDEVLDRFKEVIMHAPRAKTPLGAAVLSVPTILEAASELEEPEPQEALEEAIKEQANAELAENGWITTNGTPIPPEVGRYMLAKGASSDSDQDAMKAAVSEYLKRRGYPVE